MTPSSESTYPKHLHSTPYSSLSSLNTLDIHIPSPLDPADISKYWIIYIHGGAWRDPLQTSRTILPVLPYLLPHRHIAAVASLNYRLSPYPSHPTDPSLPNDPSRNARHPDHVRDIVAGIRYLQKEYGFGWRYVLVGHSAGGYLGGQVVCGIGLESDEEAGRIVGPTAWVGVEGIYDLTLLRDTYLSRPVYQSFIEAAFGPDEQDWERASPANGDFGHWREGRLVVLGQSRGDELVDWGQVVRMERVVRERWEKTGRRRRVEVVELAGRHADVWSEGREMARVIGVAVGMLVEEGGDEG